MNFFERISKSNYECSFDYIENFIEEQVTSWETAPNTTEIERNFTNRIKQFSNDEFALLLIHSGYIPEIYKPDSSQETLYSKLIESLVCEWAIRIGFEQSYLQTQKSNKEDITIIKDNNVIVCDAKSFRLGRSQAAPNVKDTIKKQAYSTWLEQHSDNSKVGGLVTFPSLHDWKKGSEAYQYFTEGNPSIMMLFYEQMAFMLLYGITAEQIIAFLNSYKYIYSHSSNNRNYYWDTLYKNLFKEQLNEYKDFINQCEPIIRNKVNHTITKLNDYLNKTREDITATVNKLSYEELKMRAIESQYIQECSNIERQRDNILRFRPND